MSEKFTVEALVAAINSAIAPKEEKAKKSFIIVVNDRVIPAKLTEAEYVAEVKRLAVTGAKIELYEFAGDLTTNLDVTVNRPATEEVAEVEGE